jgi:hypothetical protein
MQIHFLIFNQSKMRTRNIFRQFVSRCYSTKIGTGQPVAPVSMKKQGGKWFFEVKSEESIQPKSSRWLLRMSSVFLAIIGGLFAFDIVSKPNVYNDDLSFEETNVLKLQRAWNGMLKELGQIIVTQMNEAEKRSQVGIEQQIIEEVESQNYKVVQIREIRK